MKSTLLSILFFILLLTGRALAQDDCCMQVITSVTNSPFSCLSDPTLTISDGPNNYLLSSLTPGGIREGTLINQAPGTLFPQFIYGSGTYGYNGKMVRLFTHSSSASGLYHYITFAVDDACQRVCSWSVQQVTCPIAPCNPVANSGCQPLFSSNSILINP